MSPVFTEEEMDALMDRSDLTDGAEIVIKKEATQFQGVFKRVDVPSPEIKKEAWPRTSWKMTTVIVEENFYKWTLSQILKLASYYARY